MDEVATEYCMKDGADAEVPRLGLLRGHINAVLLSVPNQAPAPNDTEEKVVVGFKELDDS